MAFLGDSLTAGAENESLVDGEQQHGYAAVLAAQAQFPIVLPLVAPPGMGPVEELESTQFPYMITTAPGTSTGRENRTVQATDLAVPGANAWAVLNKTPLHNPDANESDITTVVLGYPVGNAGTQVQQAVAQQPSTVIVWVGVNDLIPGGPSDDPSQATPVTTFSAELAQILSTLQSQTKAKIFVANCPDLSLISAYTSGQTLVDEVAASTGQPAASLMASLGISANDLVKPSGVAVVVSELSSIRSGTPPPALPGQDFLTAGQVALLQANVAAYNQVIALQTQAVGGTLVDLYSYVNTLKSGLQINGTTLTLGYLGGFYSIDGLHFTNTGYALIANQFIAAINSSLGISIPAANVSAIAAADPLFPPNITATAQTAALAPAARAAQMLAWRARTFGRAAVQPQPGA